ncbi:MAG: translational GTPase TypA [Lachnospirales bacterium]
MLITRNDVRNVAIIAHVDHGKTTLVDELLKQSGTFRENQIVDERVMDSNDIERERGITILAKNTAIFYKGTKINIVDTPGHADFGGEVERVMKLVDGVILVVDAFEGSMPQTKFVLKKALDLDLPIVTCINKIDRPEARPDEVIDEVLELFLELDANDEQLDSPFIFASAKNGYSKVTIDGSSDSMETLFECIIKNIPAPTCEEDTCMRTLITSIDYSEYKGRIGIGRVMSGTLNANEQVRILNPVDGKNELVKVSNLYEFDGLNKVEVKESKFGSIVAISGISDINIGDTICDVDNTEPVEFVKISEPTLSMHFSVNDSPFAGREGKFVTSRHLKERLEKEANTDVSLRVEPTDTTESFKVSGRGELHLSILIENMRREGYEFQVSKPEVLFKTINDKKHEPQETVTVDVPEEFSGIVIEKLGTRKGEMTNMTSANNYTRLVFDIPARGLIGYRTEFLTDTKGNGVINSVYDKYIPYKGDIATRSQGSLVAFEDGETTGYGLFNAQDRGTLFMGPNVKVYKGMVVGMNSRSDDMDINVCKKKQLTNVRASGSDDALKLTAPRNMSLEENLEFISDDELLEVTPTSLRIRKKILDATMRMRANRK